MKWFIPFGVVFLIFCETWGTESDDDEWFREMRASMDPDLTTMEMIQEMGYDAEAHTVETKDGYILEMHRIPHKTKAQRQVVHKNQRPVVFLQHGLLGSSADFFLRSSKDSLPFLLSDMGFDVWLGNFRGNTYCKNHVTLTTNDMQFWNYSWHESAIYDLPAQIDYVLNITAKEKLIYVGYSMGGTTFFVMTTTLPEYNDKIQLGLMLAPAAYMKNSRSPLMVILAQFSKSSTVLFDLIQHGQFLPDGKLAHYISATFCSLPFVNRHLCKNIIFLICGVDPGQFDESLLPVLLHHFPAGYSIKAVAHYAQLINSGAFRQYDYGPKGNMIQYGKPKAPEYHLGNVTVPIYLYAGLNDYLTDIQDITKLSRKLGGLKQLRVIANKQFNHLDFMLAKDVKKLCYDLVIQDIKSVFHGGGELEKEKGGRGGGKRLIDVGDK